MASTAVQDAVNELGKKIKEVIEHKVDVNKIDITPVPGYDAAKKQNLKNVTGTLTFEDEVAAKEYLEKDNSNVDLPGTTGYVNIQKQTLVKDSVTDAWHLEELSDGVKKYATKVLLDAATGMKDEDLAYVIAEDSWYRYDLASTSWVTKVIPNPSPSHKDYATGTVKDHITDLIKYMHTGDPVVLHYVSAGAGGGKHSLASADYGIGYINAMAINADGNILLGGQSGKTQLVDKTGAKIGSASADYGIGAINAMTLNSDGNILLGGQSGKTQLVDKTGTAIGTTSADYGFGAINAMAVNADGNILVGGGGYPQGKTQLVDKTGAKIGTASVDYGIEVIYSMVVNADGNILLGSETSFGGGGQTQLVDKTGAKIGTASVDYGLGSIRKMTLNADGNILIGSNGSSETQLVDKTGAKIGGKTSGYGIGGIKSIITLSNGNILLGGSNQKTQLVDKTGAKIGTSSVNYGINSILSMAINADGNILLGGSSGKTILVSPLGSTTLPAPKEIHTASIIEINEKTQKVYALKNGVGTEVQDQALDKDTHITVITIFKEDGSSGITTKGGHNAFP